MKLGLPFPEQLTRSKRAHSKHKINNLPIVFIKPSFCMSVLYLILTQLLKKNVNIHTADQKFQNCDWRDLSKVFEVGLTTF